VIGDLGDLVGAPPKLPYADADHPDESEVADAAVDAIKALLLENARLLETEQRLSRELDQAHHDLHRSYLRPTYRFRERVVRRLRASRTGRGLLMAYRRARGRSSRSA